MNNFAMPKIVRINVKEYNQHTNYLGKDENNERLDTYTLKAKYRLACEIVDAIAGYGIRGA